MNHYFKYLVWLESSVQACFIGNT